MARTDRKIRIFSALEVANICGVVNQTAINWIKNGYLKAFTTPGGQYRVYAEDLVAFLHSRGMRLPEELQKILDEELVIHSVLVVDDNKEFNDSLREYLEQQFPEYQVHQAFDGFEAGKYLAAEKPGLVFLDIDLPGVDGERLLQAMKDESQMTTPIVIVVSGKTEPELETRVMEAGAEAFLAKPVDFAGLPNLIKELNKKRR